MGRSTLFVAAAFEGLDLLLKRGEGDQLRIERPKRDNLKSSGCSGLVIGGIEGFEISLVFARVAEKFDKPGAAVNVFFDVQIAIDHRRAKVNVAVVTASSSHSIVASH